MKAHDYDEEMIITGMKAWNQLSNIMDPESKEFDNIEEFQTFYTVVMSKLLEEEEAV